MFCTFLGSNILVAEAQPFKNFQLCYACCPYTRQKTSLRTFGIRQGLVTRLIEKWGKRFHVGEMFTIVDQEFAERRDELHQIAQSIRRNLQCFDVPFGYRAENNSFPEGVLLGHLHRVIEIRDSAKLKPTSRCDICQIDTSDIYPGCPSLMAMHLTVPITALDGKKRYDASEFITVCPNCHAALHRHRPWLTKENCGELLR